MPSVLVMLFPVNGSVLQWARRSRGYSLSEASEAIGISASDLEEFEAGDRQISLGRLDEMAKAYKQSRSALLRAAPPPLDPQPKYFRSLQSKVVKPSIEVLDIVREARRLQRAISKIMDSAPDLFTHAEIASYKLTDDPEDVAIQERVALGFRHVIPKQHSHDTAYHARRMLIEKSGILVFQKKWNREEGLGVSLYDAECPPSIIVNTHRQKMQARSFTLFHEYAHLLLRQTGISDQRVNDGPHWKVERWCNQVAAAILMPKPALLKYAEQQFADLAPDDWETRDIGTIARRFKVSYAAAGIRLRDCGITDAIDRMDFNLWNADIKSEPQQPKKDKARKSGEFKRSYGRERFHEVGPEVADVFLNALRDEVISTRDAAAFLDLTGTGLRSFAEIAEGGQSRPDSVA